jgi:hypothetical protein
MGRCGRSRAWEVIVIAQREREREREENVVEVPTNGVTWRRSCGDGHMTALNRAGRWCFDGDIVLTTRRRDWSRGGCGG